MIQQKDTQGIPTANNGVIMKNNLRVTAPSWETQLMTPHWSEMAKQLFLIHQLMLPLSFCGQIFSSGVCWQFIRGFYYAVIVVTE